MKRKIASSGHLQPVAFVQSTLQFTDRAVAAANVLMMSAKRDLRAKVGESRVFVAKGAAAFVVNNGRDICVPALHDTKFGDVSVLVGWQEIALRAGEQALITSSETFTWSEVIPLPGIAVRGEREHATMNGARVLTSEYSIPSAISSLPAIGAMKESSKLFERAMFARLMKNAAVMQTMSAYKGAYHPLRRTLTASAF